MPRYTYACESCEHEFQTRHSMEETLIECPECGEESLFRVLPYVSYNTKSAESKTGDIVKRSIKEAKEAIKEDRRALSKEYES